MYAVFSVNQTIEQGILAPFGNKHRAVLRTDLHNVLIFSLTFRTNLHAFTAKSTLKARVSSGFLSVILTLLVPCAYKSLANPKSLAPTRESLANPRSLAPTRATTTARTTLIRIF